MMLPVKARVRTIWREMHQRCTPGSFAQKSRPRYKGCSVAEDFQEFLPFYSWYCNQIGSDQFGYHLDKDLKIQGNKVYSAATCFLLPAQLNTFFVACDSARGEYPQGVTLYRSGKFQASISSLGRKKFLGYYDTPELAATAYEAAKVEEIKNWIKWLQDGLFPVNPEVIVALQNRIGASNE